jgi:hypothetical protein
VPLTSSANGRAIIGENNGPIIMAIAKGINTTQPKTLRSLPCLLALPPRPVTWLAGRVDSSWGPRAPKIGRSGGGHQFVFRPCRWSPHPINSLMSKPAHMIQKKRLTIPQKNPKKDIRLRNAAHPACVRFRIVFGFGCMEVVISDEHICKETYRKAEETHNNISMRHQPR